MAKRKQTKTPLGDEPETLTGPADDIDADTSAVPPKTSLLASDVMLRGATYFARQAAEKAFLGSRYSQTIAKEAMNNRSLVNTIAAYGITRLATRSVPGAILVGGGLVAKALFDQSEKRRARKAKEAAKKN